MRRVTSLLALAAIAAGCADATVNKQGVQATQNAPTSTQVPAISIPCDPAEPRYVVTVEPFTFDAGSGGGGDVPQAPGTQRYGWGPWGWYGGGLLPQGPQAEAYNPPARGTSGTSGAAISNQLQSALSNVCNISIVDWDFYLQNKGKPSTLVKKGEVGVFVIKGSVTEFNEIAEASGSSTGGSLGALGAALAIGGAIAGNSPATYTGVGLAAANPSYENTVARRTGSVAIDVKIVDPGNGRMLASFPANGSFTSESAANGVSVFGFGKASNAFAASALGQANRAAMNSATQQIWDRLRGAR